ncbi:MAG: murein transglycosylase A [Proteobacteria bacterium]|nr:murein transglycosylase A [Pseudomonadota bacterium]
MRRLLFPFALLLLFVALPIVGALWLASGEARLSFRETRFSDLEGWAEDGPSRAFEAFLKSCATLTSKSSSPVPEYFEASEYHNAFAGVCVLAEAGKDRFSKSNQAARTFFENNFTPYRLRVGWKSKGRLTGYYEPLLEASLTPHPDYPVPLHGNPGDQITVDLGKFRENLKGTTFVGRLEGRKVIPYYTREEILDGALEGRGLEILWVKDPFSAYNIQIQGSGRARLPDGTFIGIGYAGKNGHANTLAGRVLVAEGYMEKDQVSLQSIKKWLEQNPGKLEYILNKNASYVFFRLLEEGDGPFGSAGAALTAERSIAVDPAYIPLGLPVWISGSAPDPDNPTGDPIRFRRLFIAQDTGGVIKGELRADIFYGFGERAEVIAGHMNNQGAFTLLLPNGVTP